MRDRTFNLLILLGFMSGAAVLYFFAPRPDPDAPVNCLSGWDGSVKGGNAQIKAMLRDPDSYEHISTKLISADNKGYDKYVTRYRARNGFGGMDIGEASIHIDGSDCSIIWVDVR